MVANKLELLMEHIRKIRAQIEELVDQHGSILDPSVLAVTQMMMDNVIKEYEGEIKRDR